MQQETRRVHKRRPSCAKTAIPCAHGTRAAAPQGENESPRKCQCGFPAAIHALYRINGDTQKAWPKTMAKTATGTLQHPARRHQRPSKIEAGGTHESPDATKSVQEVCKRCPRDTQERPKSTPKANQEPARAPKQPQEAPKSDPRSPKRAQERPKRSPRSTQEDPRATQEAPEDPPRHPEGSQGQPKKHQDALKAVREHFLQEKNKGSRARFQNYVFAKQSSPSVVYEMERFRPNLTRRRFSSETTLEQDW